MKRRKKLRISQCMIVKNEENNIERALSWGKNIMWEQIVVDTGSSDRTVEIAESMGAKVYHFEWRNDFAAAKNYALKQAGGDWIAFLDADEYISGDEAKKIPALLEELWDSPYLVLLSEMLNLDDKGKLFVGSSHIRFFKNRPDICYVGKIHETLRVNNRTVYAGEAIDASEEFSVIHTGYARNVLKGKSKGTRNRSLLLAELEDNPNDIALLGYMGDAYSIDQEFDEACIWYEKAIEATPRTPLPFSARDSLTFGALMEILSAKGEESSLMRVYERAVERLPQDGDFDYLAGKYYACNKKDEGGNRKGINHLEKAIGLLEQYGSNLKSGRLFASIREVWGLLSLCYYNVGELNQCVRCCTILLKADPYAVSVLAILLKAFKLDAERYEREQLDGADKGSVSPAATGSQVLAFLGGIYDLNSRKDRILILKAAMEAEYEDVIRVIRATFTPEDLEVLDQVMAQKK